MPTQKPRLSVITTHEYIEYLEKWAQEDDRTLTNLLSVIIKRSIEERQKQQAELPAPNFKCLLLGNYDRLSANPKIAPRLDALMKGEEPAESEKLRIALEIGVSEEVIDKLLERGSHHANV